MASTVTVIFGDDYEAARFAAALTRPGTHEGNEVAYCADGYQVYQEDWSTVLSVESVTLNGALISGRCREGDT